MLEGRLEMLTEALDWVEQPSTDEERRLKARLERHKEYLMKKMEEVEEARAELKRKKNEERGKCVIV